MLKWLLCILFLTLTGNLALASGFVIDPTAIFNAWWMSNHWAGITAVALFTGMTAATWKMPPIANETKAVMVSDLFRLGRYIVAILLFVEYHELIVSWAINLFDLSLTIIGML